MFDAPFHPKVVHIPIALSVLMPLLTVGLLVAWFRDWLPPESWWLAVAAQLLLFAGTWMAYETGENDEESVEEIVPESAIEAHEERAELFFWTTAGGVVLMIAPMLVRGRRRRRGLALAATAGTVVVLWTGARLGEAGGELVYEHGAGEAHAAPSKVPATGAPSEDDTTEEED